MAVTWKYALVAAAAAVAVAGCNMVDGAEVLIEDESGGSDEGWSSKWSGEPFDRITLAGPDNISFTTEGEHAVSASGDDKALKRL